MTAITCAYVLALFTNFEQPPFFIFHINYFYSKYIGSCQFHHRNWWRVRILTGRPAAQPRMAWLLTFLTFLSALANHQNTVNTTMNANGGSRGWALPPVWWRGGAGGCDPPYPSFHVLHHESPLVFFLAKNVQLFIGGNCTVEEKLYKEPLNSRLFW